MKLLRLTLLSIFAITAMLFFQNCEKSNSDTPKDLTTNILNGKAEWVVSSVNVPVNSATVSSDWTSFKVSFTNTNLTTSGYPIGSQAVWPSGTYTLSEDGKKITRGDGIEISLTSITETNFSARFTVPAGTDIGGRIAALDGEYSFNMN